jgi:hypothetical protein
MDQPAARRLLGVGADASADEVRRAFRRLVLDHHPDRTGGDGDATRALVEAYRLLRTDQTDQTDPAPGSARNPLLDLVDGGSLEVELPADEAFLVVLDAAADLGDVTYVDAEAGLLEVVLATDGGGRASLVLTLQGRAALGTTEVFGTLEPLA